MTGGAAASAGGLAAIVTPPSEAGPARRLALGGALLLLSSACQRFAVYRAGVASADDPSYTVREQRERIASTGQEPAIRR